MKEESFGGTFETIPVSDVAQSAPTAPTEQTATQPAAVPARPVQDAQPKPEKPRVAARAKGFMLDVFFAVGVFVFGGTLALYGIRKASVLRVALEVALAAAFVVAGYLALGWFAADVVADWSLGKPLDRSAAFVALALVLSYAGGTVSYWGWRYSRDPRVGMLVLALGVALLGGRVASLGMAFEELRVSRARAYTADEAFDALASLWKRQPSIDVGEMKAVTEEFRSAVYGPSFATGLSDAWKYRTIVRDPAVGVVAPAAPAKAAQENRATPVTEGGASSEESAPAPAAQ